MKSRTARALLLLALAVGTGGCAGRRARSAVNPSAAVPAPIPTEPAASVAEPTPAPVEGTASAPAPTPGELAAAEAVPEAEPAPPPAKHSLRDLCRVTEPEEEPMIDEARRRLQETVCGANLWFDGLFGERVDVANARAVSGRLEASDLYSQAEGNQLKLRLRLRYDLPNLDNRVALFLGRGDERELIEDRIEGVAVRSSIFGLDSEDDWIAGLGYAPPGRLGSRLDFRVGTRVKSSPEVYVQGRYRQGFLVGERSAIRLRETVFWENREDGFGTTASVDFEHLLNPRLLFRWGSVATLSQDTEGTRWRTGFFVYQGLEHRRALLYQVFVRGESAAEVPLREYGTRAIFRMPVGRPWLFGTFTAGYSWPRFDLESERDGSALVGFGIELQFGENPR